MENFHAEVQAKFQHGRGWTAWYLAPRPGRGRSMSAVKGEDGFVRVFETEAQAIHAAVVGLNTAMSSPMQRLVAGSARKNAKELAERVFKPGRSPYLRVRLSK